MPENIRKQFQSQFERLVILDYIIRNTGIEVLFYVHSNLFRFQTIFNSCYLNQRHNILMKKSWGHVFSTCLRKRRCSRLSWQNCYCTGEQFPSLVSCFSAADKANFWKCCLHIWMIKLNSVNYFMCLFWLRWRSAVYKYIKLLIFYGLEGSNDVDNVTQWFPNVVPWPVKVSVARGLVTRASSRNSPQPYWSRSSACGGQQFVFYTSPPGNSDALWSLRTMDSKMFAHLYWFLNKHYILF